MSEYFKGEKQSLEDILIARDLRVDYQMYLINKYNSTIVSFKLNIPGDVKYNELIKAIFDEGLGIFKLKVKNLAIAVTFEKAMYKNSGPEYFAVFHENENSIKKITTEIEETHPLGRLFDFDVLDSKGNQISRVELGYKPRKCLICDANAFECGRSRKHEIYELIEKIKKMTVDYFKK